MKYPIKLETTEDGYTFYLLESGKVVDDLDPEFEDMSWSSLDSFIESQHNGSACK